MSVFCQATFGQLKEMLLPREESGKNSVFNTDGLITVLKNSAMQVEKIQHAEVRRHKAIQTVMGLRHSLEKRAKSKILSVMESA